MQQNFFFFLCLKNKIPSSAVEVASPLQKLTIQFRAHSTSLIHLILSQIYSVNIKGRVLQHAVPTRFPIWGVQNWILVFISALVLSTVVWVNPLNDELNPICYLLALLGAHHFFHVSRIRVKSLTLRLLMSYIYIYIYIYIYEAPILDVSRSHTTTQHSR